MRSGIRECSGESDGSRRQPAKSEAPDRHGCPMGPPVLGGWGRSPQYQPACSRTITERDIGHCHTRMRATHPPFFARKCTLSEGSTLVKHPPGNVLGSSTAQGRSAEVLEQIRRVAETST